MLAIKDLTGNDLDVIVRNLVRREIERGTVLFEKGQKATSTFFVETGSLKIVIRKAKDGLDDVIDRKSVV